MTRLGQDFRYGLRQLRRSPSFALTALVTLALGIGANVVAFGVLNAMLLKPLDVPQPAGLYNVVHQQPGDDNQSYPLPTMSIFAATIERSAIWRPTGCRTRAEYRQCNLQNAGTTKPREITLTCSERSSWWGGSFTRATSMDRTQLLMSF